MTPDPTLPLGAAELDAGPALDAAISTRIFNRKAAVFGEQAVLWAKCSSEGHDGGHWYGTVPPYSTDIAAAWVVVGRLTQQWAYVNLDYKAKIEKWVCHVSDGLFGIPERQQPRVAAITAPLAICRTALAATAAPPAPESTEGGT